MSILITIITVNYNNKAGLEKTIASVVNQTYKNIEYIIIDGGSQDESMDVVKRFKDKISVVISEPDKGPYDAMNKGIDKAHGEYLLFLNSGDYLASDTVLEKFIDLETIEDIVYGDSYMDEKGKLKRKRMPKTLTIGVGLTHTINHQTIFFKNTLFADERRYDLRYPIVADWVFVNEALLSKECTTKHIDLVVPVYDVNGMSSNPKLRRNEREEYIDRLDSRFKKLHADYVLLNARYNLITNNPLIKLLLKLYKYLK